MYRIYDQGLTDIGLFNTADLVSVIFTPYFFGVQNLKDL